jgi:hypothetical protein
VGDIAIQSSLSVRQAVLHCPATVATGDANTPTQPASSSSQQQRPHALDCAARGVSRLLFTQLAQLLFADSFLRPALSELQPCASKCSLGRATYLCPNTGGQSRDANIRSNRDSDRRQPKEPVEKEVT